MGGWVDPESWSCVCGASGHGGRAALDTHTLEMHTLPPAGVVPPGVDAKAVRAWCRVHGWPDLGDRGRLPQPAINAYVGHLLRRLVEYGRAYRRIT